MIERRKGYKEWGSGNETGLLESGGIEIWYKRAGKVK
jgi:hypothetical protein